MVFLFANPANLIYYKLVQLVPATSINNKGILIPSKQKRVAIKMMLLSKDHIELVAKEVLCWPNRRKWNSKAKDGRDSDLALGGSK